MIPERLLLRHPQNPCSPETKGWNLSLQAHLEVNMQKKNKEKAHKANTLIKLVSMAQLKKHTLFSCLS